MEETKKEYHFISRKRTDLILPKRDFSGTYVTARNNYRTIERQRTQKISGVINQIITTKQLPTKSEWSFSVKSCGGCGGSVFGGITCSACGMVVCSNCRQTYSIDNGNYDITLCMLCSECFERMENSNWFEQKIEEGEDKEVVLIHLKVTKTLLLFDETFRTMKAFEGVEGLNDESFLKECKERLREFQIVLQKVADLKGIMENFITKADKIEIRIVQNLLHVWSLYNKEKVLKAITFAQQFSKEIEKDQKKLEEMKEKSKKFEITGLENTCISSNGGVLKINAENIDPSLKVFVNGNVLVPTVKQNIIYLQIPKQIGENDQIRIEMISKYGNIQLFDTIFYEHEKNKNQITSSSRKTHLFSKLPFVKKGNVEINKPEITKSETTVSSSGSSGNNGSWIKKTFFQKFGSKEESDEEPEIEMKNEPKSIIMDVRVTEVKNEVKNEIKNEPKSEIQERTEDKKKLFVFEEDSSDENEDKMEIKKEMKDESSDENSDENEEEVIFIKKPEIKELNKQNTFVPLVKENEFPKIQDGSNEIQEFNINSNETGWKTIDSFDDFEILDIDSMDIKMEILSLSPSAFSVKGGKLTIKGKNFGNKPIVFVRNKKVDDKRIVSISSKEIVIMLPPLTVGLVTIRIENEFGQTDSCVDAVRVFDDLPSQR